MITQMKQTIKVLVIMKPINEKVDKDLLLQAIRTDGFNSEVIDDEEMAFYLEQLKDWLAYVPTPEEIVNPMLLKIYGNNAPEESMERVTSGQTYRHLIRSVYIGVIAMQGLGGKFYSQEIELEK